MGKPLGRHFRALLVSCLIALVVVAVNITKSKNIIVGHEGDKAFLNYVTVVLPEFYKYGTGTLF